MGHRMAALVRIIKHARLRIIICDMDNLWLHDVPGPPMLFLTCDLVFLWSDDYDIRHYLSRVLHAHYIHVIVYIHGLISHDLVFCYFRWYFICQFILPSDLLFIHSSALIILFFTFTFPYYCFLFSCVHLLVHFWRTVIFQHQSSTRLMSHYSKKPRKTTRREPEFLIFVF